jgi:mercuric ion transport protein
MKTPAPENASILAGTVSALGASACCALPLVLVSLGLGGAWIAQLRALERFYPVLVLLAVGAFAFGFYRLYVRPAPCEPEAAACAAPATRRRQRITFWSALIFAKILILSPFIYGSFNS